jgi:hypothetical protein
MTADKAGSAPPPSSAAQSAHPSMTPRINVIAASKFAQYLSPTGC